MTTVIETTAAAAAPIRDCWNSIGVRGDGSCAELEIYSQCRNCPVFAAAAVDVLDRDPPLGYVAEWTRHFAAEKASEEDLDVRAALIFRIDTEWLALPTEMLDEVAEHRPIHSLPHRRGGTLLGLVNIRGELLPCVSLGRMLGIKDGSGGDERQGLVVVRHEAGRVAFPVDEVQSLHRYHARDVRAAPATLRRAAASHTSGVFAWRDRMVGCLDETLITPALTRAVS